jgi:hypothetical protein
LKHGAQAAAGTVLVHVIDASTTRAQAADIIIMLRLPPHLDVNIQCVQPVTVIAADLNVKVVLDVPVMFLDLI